MIRLGREIDAAGVAELIAPDVPVVDVTKLPDPAPDARPQLRLLAGGAEPAAA